MRLAGCVWEFTANPHNPMILSTGFRKNTMAGVGIYHWQPSFCWSCQLSIQMLPWNHVESRSSIPWLLVVIWDHPFVQNDMSSHFKGRPKHLIAAQKLTNRFNRSTLNWPISGIQASMLGGFGHFDSFSSHGILKLDPKPGEPRSRTASHTAKIKRKIQHTLQWFDVV